MTDITHIARPPCHPGDGTSHLRRPVSILGAGHIGFAIALLLQQTGDYDILVADRDPMRLAKVAALGIATRQTAADADWSAVIDGRFAVLDALPFHCAIALASACAQAGVHYFDLTEDVPSTQAIRALAAGARSVLMPQCGLAPGFIGIVGNDLARRFERLDSLRLRVGALPRYPQGALRYNLTWSTEGLINEYCNPCEAIVDGLRTTVAPLEGLENFVLDGVEYEAFNTSGGLGTLTETLAGRARQVDYQSIRYPGHCAIVKLLLNDLRLRERRELLRDILESAIPSTDQDVIVVCATACGLRGGRLAQHAYCARIFGTEVAGHALSAIELTTAAGICTALDLLAQGRLPHRGFVGQEAVALADFLANRFGMAYAGQGALAL
ncbi:saccharopine dehydrogenase family protein [Verminephrobacter eiseniae]|nr:saccharopine dehydrogenase NADP-binding domain-containing protein [Verminephrobacter eiseniae]MCW5286433.1 saccharopine dehydrogenase family protein [Verminephrobacter eiseniae]MCW5304732.1 saccharopine dehydrogenase family protein [Verminephrobacter eiseniae]MCW8182241.1 saccharopine dehydrogenase family protein [Verminephrobacter eiseniae]MCW8192603.1 saccharopine dehydrogenase family protein [Verminephrobacter eiseniae]